MSGALARAPRGVLTHGERMTGMEHDLAAHQAVDDLRFQTLTEKIEEVKTDVAGLASEMRTGFAAVNASITRMEGKLEGHAQASGDGGSPPPGHWHIGPLGQWAIAMAAACGLGLLGWAWSQVYDLQPARIKAAQAPASVVIQSAS